MIRRLGSPGFHGIGGIGVADMGAACPGGAVPWWLSGGILAANCIAAYTPKGAASLAASYDNNAAPGNGLPDGTYDAAPGVAPTLVAGGWSFAAGFGQYLDTGLSMATTGYKVFARFSGVTNSGMVLGFQGTAWNNSLLLRPSDGSNRVMYQNASSAFVAPQCLTGTLGIITISGYRNGNLDTAALGNYVGDAFNLYIGALNQMGVPILFLEGTVSHVAVYSALTAAQMLALHNATV